MTKIDGRTKAEAARQIDESLQRLQTDHIDLMQFHEVIRLEDPDRIFAEGGAHGGHARSKEGRQGSLHRLYRPQGSAGPPAHARHSPRRTSSTSTPCRCRSTSWTPTSAALQHNVLPVLNREGIAPLGMKSFGDHVHSRQQNRRRPSSACTTASTCPSPCRSPASTARQFSIRPLKPCEPSSPCPPRRLPACWNAPASPQRGKYELFKTTQPQRRHRPQPQVARLKPAGSLPLTPDPCL